MKKLVFITGNKAKAQDVQKILNFPIEVKDIELDEIQELDLEKVAKQKVLTAFDRVKAPVFIDDVGLEIEIWNNFPGPLIKWMLKAGGEKGANLILDMLNGQNNRNAIAKLIVAYHDGNRIHTFLGAVKGTIAKEQRSGNNFGFGWDSVFIPDGFNKTFGEMTFEEKNQISHRRIAFDKFKKYLNSQS